jgi:hypothetical protein
MSRNDGRKLLYDQRYVAGYARALREARADLHEMDFRHKCEIAELREMLSEARREFEALRRATLEREKAEGVALLQRDRERLAGRTIWLH